jgi:putative methionine-R-sulfoxide reductase with GAF domain
MNLSSPTPPTSTQAESENRQAFGLMLGLAGVMLIISIGTAVGRGTLDLLLLGTLVPPVLIFGLAMRARRGAILSSFIILTILMYGMFSGTAVVTTGLGIIQAVFAFIVLLGIASQILSKHLFAIGTVLATLSTGLVLQELFWPIIRPVVPSSQYNVFAATSVVVSIVFLVLIFRRFNEYSMQVKFVLSVTVLAVMSIAITIVFVSITIQQSLTQQVGQNLNAIAQARAASLGEYFGRELKLLETLSSDRTMQFALQRTNDSYSGLSSSEVRTFLLERESRWLEASTLQRNLFVDVQATLSLRQYTQIFPNNVELVAVDRFGGLIANAGEPQQYYYGDESWFVRAYSSGVGNRYISDPFVLSRERYDPGENLAIFDRDEPVIGVEVAVPIVFRDPSRTRLEAIGAVKATIVLNDVLPQLQKPRELGETGEVDWVIRNYVVATNGVYLPSSEFVTTDALYDLTSGNFTVDDYQGAQSFVAYSRLSSSQGEAVIASLPWIIVVHQTESEALALVAEQQRTQVLVGVGILAVASIAATFVGRLVANPILELATAAQRFRAGERNVRANVQSGDEIGRLAESFNQLAEQVQRDELFLEQRVAERTRALETSARISRSLSTVIDQQELVLAVVAQIQEAFSYYHVHIYLMSEDGRKLDMAGGTGHVGQQLLAQKHSLPLGVGLVGRSANTNTVIIVPDVTRDHTWKPNPLLPDTKAEIAVPIALGQQVLGVLDVQNRDVNSLSEQDASLLQAIANQVAVGLRNADLYARAQREAEREQRINEIGQKIQRTSDVESALRVALYELGTALKQTPTAVTLHKEANGHE